MTVLAFGLPMPLLAQQVTDDAPITVAVSEAVAPRMVVGTVTWRGTGRPIEGAQVLLGTSAGILSDSLGRFRFEAPSTGRFAMAVRLPGYTMERRDVEVPTESGLVAHVELEESRQPLCGLIVCGPFCASVRVIVHDALTGKAPEGPVVLRAERDSDVYWDFAHPEPGSHAVRLQAGWAPGMYDVEVWAPGYATWRRDDNRVKDDPCGMYLGGISHVWLLRVDESDVDDEQDGRS